MKLKYNQYPPTSDFAFLSFFDIESTVNPGQVYLRRLRIVQTPWFAFYLHWINEPDTDRSPHDHPWGFWSYVLRGGYTEEVFDSLTAEGRHLSRECFSCHYMPTDKAHWITSVAPKTLTFVVCGPRVREWSFWPYAGAQGVTEVSPKEGTPADLGPRVRVPWRKYLGLPLRPAMDSRSD